MYKSHFMKYITWLWTFIRTFREDFGNGLSQRGFLCHHQNRSHVERCANGYKVTLQSAQKQTSKNCCPAWQKRVRSVLQIWTDSLNSWHKRGGNSVQRFHFRCHVDRFPACFLYVCQGYAAQWCSGESCHFTQEGPGFVSGSGRFCERCPRGFFPRRSGFLPQSTNMQTEG